MDTLDLSQSSNTTTNGTTDSSTVFRLYATLFFVTVSVVAIPANLVLIACLWRDTASAKTSGFNTYTISVGFADLLVGGGISPLRLFVGYYSEPWPLGKATCILWKLLDYGLTSASMFLFLAMGYDRYRAVTSPLKYRFKFAKSRVILVSLAMWCSGFGIWLPYILLKLYKGGGYETCLSFSSDTEYTDIIQVILAYHLPVLLLAVMNLILFRSLKQPSKIPKLRHTKTPKLQVLQNIKRISGIPNRTVSTSTPVVSSACCIPLDSLTNQCATSNPLSSSAITSVSEQCEEQRESNPTQFYLDEETNTFKCIPGTPKAKIYLPQVENESDQSSTLSNVRTHGCNNKAVSKTCLPIANRLRASRSSSARKVLLMVITFLLFWLPFCVIWSANIFCSNCLHDNITTAFGLLTYGQSAANPIVLICSSTDIKAKVSSLFSRTLKENRAYE